MEDEIRPEVQKYLAQMRTIIAKLDAETKAVDAENEKKQAEIDASLKEAAEKDDLLSQLTMTAEQLQVQSQCLDDPLEEFMAAEEQHQSEVEEAERTLNELKEERRQLLAEKASYGGDEINDIHEGINFNLAELTMSSGKSQVANMAVQKRELADAVFQLQNIVQQEREAVQALKDKWKASGACTTTRAEREYATEMLNAQYKATKTLYITSKVELLQLKQKCDN